MQRSFTLLALLVLAALACILPVGLPTPTPKPPIPTPTEPPPAATATTPSPAPAEPTAASASTEGPTPAATPAAQPSFIAYVFQGQLLVTDVTGGVKGGTTQYTSAGVDDKVYDLVWSPSGEYIAYGSNASAESHIFYVYAVGAGTPVDLGPGADPAWSPDSNTLAYVRDNNLWLTAIEHPAPKPITFQQNWAWGRPVFTPDGSALIVADNSVDFLGAQGNTQFFLDRVPLDGSGTMTRLPGMTQPADGRLPRDIRYSPDGQRLAFSTTFHLSACSAPGDYYVLAADGSKLTRLAIPSFEPALDTASDISLRVNGYAWSPQADALALTGGVWDCSTIDSGGEPKFIAGPQLSIVGLDAAERLTIPGFLAWPSYDRAATMLAASLVANDGQGPSRVLLYSPSGDLLLDLGEGDFPEFQP